MVEELLQIAPLQVFCNDSMEGFYLISPEVLRRTSIQVTLPEAVELLQKTGCWVDGDRLEFNNREQKGAINAQ